MRVLHLLKTSHGANWAVRQMRELVGMGIDVHVAMPPGGPRAIECRAAGITVHSEQIDFPARRPWALPRTLARMRRLVSKVQPDMIHSHFVGTTLTMRLALGRKSRMPRVFQVPGPLHLASGPFGKLELALAGPEDHWIASCRWTREKYLLLGIPEGRVSLSFYGTCLKPFANLDRDCLRAELGVSREARLVGMVACIYPPKYYLGQLRGLKGHEDFLAAMAIVRKRRPGTMAVIAGSQWGGGHSYENRLRAQAARLLGDGAFWLGQRHDVPSIYAGLDAAVHPSLSENLGGAVESLLAAAPTVANQVGGLPDIVRHGETGWLVPARCPGKLAETILQALADPHEAQRRASNGQALVRQRLDVRRTAQEIRSIYEKIVAA